MMHLVYPLRARGPRPSDGEGPRVVIPYNPQQLVIPIVSYEDGSQQVLLPNFHGGGDNGADPFGDGGLEEILQLAADPASWEPGGAIANLAAAEAASAPPPPECDGPPPASEEAIARIPVVTVQADELMRDSNAECCVCLESHAVGARARRLPCGHLFHDGCVTAWLTKHCTCPVCRFEVATDDATFERQRTTRNRAGGRRVCVWARELEGMRVRALRDILHAAGEDDVGCVERSDLVEKINAAPSVDVVADEIRTVDRSALDAMSTGEVVRLARSLGIAGIRGSERGDVVALLLASPKVQLVAAEETAAEEEGAAAAEEKKPKSPRPPGFAKGFLAGKIRPKRQSRAEYSWGVESED